MGKNFVKIKASPPKNSIFLNRGEFHGSSTGGGGGGGVQILNAIAHSIFRGE